MIFPAYILLGFLNHEGWPRTKGLLIRKKVVSCAVLSGGLVELVQAGIALGASRPKIATALLADSFAERDWSLNPGAELWTNFDPSKKVTNKSDKRPAEVIAEQIQYPQFSLAFYNDNPEKALRDFVEWKFILSDLFTTDYHIVFVQGLIWGLSHPEEALASYEEERKRLLTRLPLAISAGLNVPPQIETLEEFADVMEEAVNSFQNKIRPLAEIPQELLKFPTIATRLNSRIFFVDLSQEPKIAGELNTVIERVCDRVDCDVAIDFSGVDYVTNWSLTKLLKLRKLLADHEHKLVLHDVSEPIKKILRFTDLYEIFELADDKPLLKSPRGE